MGILKEGFVLLGLGGERAQMEGGLKYVTLNLLSSALFLAAVGVGAGVHLLTLFYLDLDGGKGGREALVHALRRSGLPILLTTLTTAATSRTLITSHRP